VISAEILLLLLYSALSLVVVVGLEMLFQYSIVSVVVEALWKLFVVVQVLVVGGTVPGIPQFPFSVFVEVMDP